MSKLLWNIKWYSLLEYDLLIYIFMITFETINVKSNITFLSKHIFNFYHNKNNIELDC